MGHKEQFPEAWKKTEEIEIRGRIDTIYTKALLRSAKILRRDLVPWGNLRSLRLRLKENSNNNNNNRFKSSTLGTILKNQEKKLKELEICGNIRATQGRVLLISRNIQRNWRIVEICGHSISSESYWLVLEWKLKKRITAVVVVVVAAAAAKWIKY